MNESLPLRRGRVVLHVRFPACPSRDQIAHNRWWPRAAPAFSSEPGYDLQVAFTSAKFRTEIDECRKVVAQLVADDNSSDQQIARVNILRCLGLQLSRATEWADSEADLLAVVLRSEIELRGWAEFVSPKPGGDSGEAERAFRKESGTAFRDVPEHHRVSATLASQLCRIVFGFVKRNLSERSAGRILLAEKGARGKGR